jgi:hypothetical protein
MKSPDKYKKNKGGIGMNQETFDQEWQRMQMRINQLVGRFLKEDHSSIEDSKSQSVELLPMPSGYNDDNIEDAA